MNLFYAILDRHPEAAGGGICIVFMSTCLSFIAFLILYVWGAVIGFNPGAYACSDKLLVKAGNFIGFLYISSWVVTLLACLCCWGFVGASLWAYHRD